MPAAMRIWTAHAGRYGRICRGIHVYASRNHVVRRLHNCNGMENARKLKLHFYVRSPLREILRSQPVFDGESGLCVTPWGRAWRDGEGVCEKKALGTIRQPEGCFT